VRNCQVLRIVVVFIFIFVVVVFVLFVYEFVLFVRFMKTIGELVVRCKPSPIRAEMTSQTWKVYPTHEANLGTAATWNWRVGRSV